MRLLRFPLELDRSGLSPGVGKEKFSSTLQGFPDQSKN